MEHRSHETDFSVQQGSVNHGNQRPREFASNVAHAELLKGKQVGGSLNCSDSELCTFLLALAGGYLPTFYSDTSPSVRLSGMDIASKSYQRGKKTVTFHGFQSLEMSSNLTESLGVELLTWWLEDFPVKTLVPQGKGQESMEQNQDYGKSLSESFAKYDPFTHGLKTVQHSLFEDSTKLSVTLPRWGMTVNGECFRVPRSEGSTYEKDYSYLPTPTAHNAKEGAYPSEYTRNTPTLATHAGGKINPEWSEHLMAWPLGHTDLKPLATGKTRKWSPGRGESFQKD